MGNVNNNYSHLINFYADNEQEAEEIIGGLKKKYDIELEGLAKTQRGNFKARVSVNKEDVCDVCCVLTEHKKNVFVFEWSALRERFAESDTARNKYYKAARYLIETKLDDGKTAEEIVAQIKSGEFYNSPVIEGCYKELLNVNVSSEAIESITLKSHRVTREYLDSIRYKTNEEYEAEKNADEAAKTLNDVNRLMETLAANT